jgi:hypothetical protein
MRDPDWEAQFRQTYRARLVEARRIGGVDRVIDEFAQDVLEKYGAEAVSGVWSMARKDAGVVDEATLEPIATQYAIAVARLVRGTAESIILDDTVNIHGTLGDICLAIFGDISPTEDVSTSELNDES